MKKGLLTFLVLALVGTVSIGWGEDARMVEAQALYDTYCVSCHGEDLDGNGEVAELLDPYPRNFNKYQFVAAYRDRFKDSLLHGVAGSAMPPWKNILSEAQIEMLIDFIEMKTFEKEPVVAYTRIDAALPQPGEPERLAYSDDNKVLEVGDAERGYEAYHKHCTSCHGKLANGKGPNALALGHALPRNLINKHFLNQPHITDERLYQSILLGVAGAPMPAHDHLSDQTILDLIAFIRSNIEESN